MKSYLTRGLPLAGALLLAVTPMAGAWNLVSKINADARQMPGGPTTQVVASGTASAYDNGKPEQYSGRVHCGGAASCLFGPLSYTKLTAGYPAISPMGCISWTRDCWANGGVDTNVMVSNGITFDQAIRAWVNKFGSSVTRSYGYAYTVQPGWVAEVCGAWSTYGRGFYGLVPGSVSCVPGTIPANQCTVSGATVILNYGPLKLGAINGVKKETTRAVTCARSAAVRYQVSVGNPFAIGNGIDSLITVNGVRAGELINLPSGTSVLRIASTLTDKGAQTGRFSKTVVLIQSFM
ncbi:MAG: hypothetical protein J6N20_08440 [Pseudomonas sp.]|nr:hypothetical protein [Pseudomonas sp.]